MPKKPNWDKSKAIPIYVAGRVKGDIKEKVLKDLDRGKTQQQIISEALNLLYSSSHSY